MSERCETDKTPQAKANATDKFNSIARHNQRHCLFDNAATTNQAIFSAIFNSLLERFKAQLLGADTDKLSLEDRLRVLQKDFNAWYHTALEIEVVMRTNAQIAELEECLSARDNEQMAREYELLFPEFAATKNPRDLVGIACFLMRGLASDSSDIGAERKFKIFVTMVQVYLDSSARK